MRSFGVAGGTLTVIATLTTVAHADPPPNPATGSGLQASGSEAPATSPTPAPAVAPSGAAPAVPPPAPYPFLPPPPWAPVTYQRPLTFNASEPEAELQVRSRDADDRLTWKTICTGACTTTAFTGAEYRVSGRGVSTSKTFKILPSPYPASVHAEAGSSGARTGGLVLLPIGGVAFVIGMVALVLGGECYECDSVERGQQRDRALTIGLPMMAAGAAGIAGGIILIVSNRTKLDFTPGTVASTPRVKLGRGFELAADGLRF